jgi:hypothetical protein
LSRDIHPSFELGWRERDDLDIVLLEDVDHLVIESLGCFVEIRFCFLAGGEQRVLLSFVKRNCPGWGLGSEQAEGIRQGCRIAGQGVDDGPALLLGG